MEIKAAPFRFSPVLCGEYEAAPAAPVTPIRPDPTPSPRRLAERPALGGFDDYYRVTDGLGRPLTSSDEWGVDF